MSASSREKGHEISWEDFHFLEEEGFQGKRRRVRGLLHEATIKLDLRLRHTTLIRNGTTLINCPSRGLEMSMALRYGSLI